MSQIVKKSNVPNPNTKSVRLQICKGMSDLFSLKLDEDGRLRERVPPGDHELYLDGKWCIVSFDDGAVIVQLRDGPEIETDVELKDDEFVCEQCGEICQKGRSDEEADSEAEELFGVKSASSDPGMSQICDDCFELVGLKNVLEKRHEQRAAGAGNHD